jgi:hypothetical protein
LTYCKDNNIINARAINESEVFNMSPRTGRPPKDNPRNCDLNIRLTKQEKDDIQFVADELGVTRTDAILQGIAKLKAELIEK